MRAASTTSKSKSSTTRRNASISLRARAYIYVYCAVRGVPPARSVSVLLPLPGGAAPRVLALTNTISLIVSEVPSDTYGSDAIESRLRDLDWVARCGTAHHAVSDEVARKHTVVPFRLFTLFSDEAKARAVLARRARRIDAALKRVAGKGEWVLRIGKPEPARAEDAERARGEGADGAEPSGTSFLQRKAATRQALAERAKRVREDATTVFVTLADIAAESTHRPIDPAAGLVLDAAFLVPARRLPAFKRALSKAAERLLRDGCRVSLTGPWPPYSFVSLEHEARRG